ncbi:hypothetical protein [Bradyrhizobium elkanii]
MRSDIEGAALDVTRAHWFGDHHVSCSLVQIYVDPRCASLDERIQLSFGTREVTAEEVNALNYEPGARLPLEPWRPLSANERSLLISKHVPPTRERSVVLSRIPALSKNAREAVIGGESGAVREEIVRPLTEICEFDEPLHVIGLSHRARGLKTATIDNLSGKYAGLHIDSWDDHDDHDIALREQATNRISLNAGESHRYFLFLPVTFADMHRILGTDAQPERYQSLKYLERNFMANFPELPVVRCKLLPGDCYIAPTENVVHDGSTEDGEGLDLQFVVRGFINLKARQGG